MACVCLLSAGVTDAVDMHLSDVSWHKKCCWCASVKVSSRDRCCYHSLCVGVDVACCLLPLDACGVFGVPVGRLGGVFCCQLLPMQHAGERCSADWQATSALVFTLQIGNWHAPSKGPQRRANVLYSLRMVGYLSFLKVGPQLLRFVPGKKAKDLRAWLTAYSYWNQVCTMPRCVAGDHDLSGNFAS